MNNYKDNANKVHYQLTQLFSDVEVEDTRHALYFSASCPKNKTLSPKLEFSMKVNKNILSKLTESIQYEYFIDPKKKDMSISMGCKYEDLNSEITQILKEGRMDESYLKTVSNSQPINEQKAKNDIPNRITSLRDCFQIKENILTISTDDIVSFLESKGLECSVEEISKTNMLNQYTYIINENKKAGTYYENNSNIRHAELTCIIKKDGIVDIPSLLTVESLFRGLSDVTLVSSSQFNGKVSVFFEFNDKIRDIKA